MNAEPNAALIDAAALVAGLFLARHLLLAAFGIWHWSRWVSRWLRRGLVVAIVIPALRLVTLAIGNDDLRRMVILWLAAAAILSAGVLLLALDGALAGRRIRPRPLETE